MIPVHIIGNATQIDLQSVGLAEAQVVLVVDGDPQTIKDACVHDIPVVLFYSKGIGVGMNIWHRNVVDVVSASSNRDALPVLYEKITAAAMANTTISAPKIPEIKSKLKGKETGILVIGSSTGGPATLQSLLSVLPHPFPVPIVIVQHLPEHFSQNFAQSLQQQCTIPVRLAEQDAEIQPGIIYLAKGGLHLEVSEIKRFSYVDEPPQCGVKPSVNYLFASAAKVYGREVLALVLTGMGKDGLEGAKVIKQYNGTVLAQDMKSSVIYGMPKEIVMNGLADAVVSLDQMAVTLVQITE